MSVQISGTNARFLNPTVVLGEVMRVLEPNLIAMDLIPFVDTKGQPVVYGVKDAKTNDPKKQQPRLTTPSSMFPEVQITRMTKRTALTSAEGLQLRFDKSALSLPSGTAMIMDGLETVGYWMAEYLNSAVYRALDAGSTDDGIIFAADWGAGNCTPVKDLMDFKNTMIVTGKPFRMTDIFVDSQNFAELEGFLMSSEHSAFQNAVINAPFTDKIIVPIEGRPVVHRMMDGMNHGDIMGIDARNKTIAAMFYHNDPMFGTPGTISYQTVEAGREVTKTVKNFGLNMHSYFEDSSHDTILQVWADTQPVVKDALGIRTGDGL